MGTARSGEGQQPTRALLRTVSVGMAALALAMWIGVGASTASASRVHAATSRYRIERLCGRPRPRAASCAAMRLVPSLTTAERRVRAIEQGAAKAAGVFPQVTDASPFPGYLTPQDLRAAYQLPTETESAPEQTIAVIDAYDDPAAEADLGVYDEQFGLPACTSANGCFSKVDEQGQPGPLPPENGEWAGEISIDVQMAHAVCSGCHVLLVEAESDGLEDLGAAAGAAAAAGATEISNSYVGPEEPGIASFYTGLAASFYDHPGVVVTASSGDCGYLNEACAGEPATANFPADSPDVVAVGGTSLVEKKETWSASVWDEAGSGCSQIFAAPLWQSAAPGFAATGCGAERSVADVAAVANPKTGVDIYDSVPEGNGEPIGWTVFGGTSVSSPIVAAEFALAGGAGGAAYPAANLYAHLGDGADLYDVVTGANGSCGGASSCQAVVGFDGPTGVGSPLGLVAFTNMAGEERPVLSGFTPSSGITGSTVQIEGRGLGAVSAVEFGKLAASFTVLSPTLIEATVPNGAKAGAISLVSPDVTVKSKPKFKPTLSVIGLNRESGVPGTVVTIKGIGFNSSSTVGFGGVAASVKRVSAKQLKATVPTGALAGAVTVRNTAAPIGTVSSASSFTP
jgi:IPT/TIG domain